MRYRISVMIGLLALPAIAAADEAPSVEHTVPDARTGWARNEVDQFIARQLENTGLTPAREADRHELVRRAYFDLHWQRLIRELLDNPRYGERWAQHWLDVVRYAVSIPDRKGLSCRTSPTR